MTTLPTSTWHLFANGLALDLPSPEAFSEHQIIGGTSAGVNAERQRALFVDTNLSTNTAPVC